MKISLPTGIEVNPHALPEDFEQQIKDAFADFTGGTSEAYTFQDKLYFIDMCVSDCHRTGDPDDMVMGYIKKRMAYDLEDGSFPQESEYFDIDTMADIFKLGNESQRLYSHDYDGDRYDEEAIERMLIRIMKAVLDWGQVAESEVEK